MSLLFRSDLGVHRSAVNAACSFVDVRLDPPCAASHCEGFDACSAVGLLSILMWTSPEADMPVADAGRQGKKYLGVKSSFLQDNDQILEFIMHEGTFHARLVRCLSLCAFGPPFGPRSCSARHRSTDLRRMLVSER